MAEWTKAQAWSVAQRACVPKGAQGFESLPRRCIREKEGRACDVCERVFVRNEVRV